MSCKAGLLFKAARKPGARVRLFADRLCHGLRPVAVALTVAFTSLAHAAYADPIRGEATLTPQSNYARLVLQFEEDVPTEVTVAGSILVIQFRKQVTVPIDLLSEAAPAYVGSVRRDPDGTAIRMALTQKLRVNVMTAGERVFIDLLPEKWVGLPPALPAEVVKELSDRAIAAERALRIQKTADEARKRPPVRVRASVQPTFVRFVFEMPDGVSVSSSLAADGVLAVVHVAAGVRSRGCQDRDAREHPVDQSEDRRRNLACRYFVDRRGGRSRVPRRQELCRRCRFRSGTEAEACCKALHARRESQRNRAAHIRADREGDGGSQVC